MTCALRHHLGDMALGGSGGPFPSCPSTLHLPPAYSKEEAKNFFTPSSWMNSTPQSPGSSSTLQPSPPCSTSHQPSKSSVGTRQTPGVTQSLLSVWQPCLWPLRPGLGEMVREGCDDGGLSGRHLLFVPDSLSLLGESSAGPILPRLTEGGRT